MITLPSRFAPGTLRGRLSLVALTTATLLMVVLTVSFNAVVRHHLRSQGDDELRARTAAVAATVETGGASVRVLETPDDRLLDANVWIYAGTRLLERPTSAPTTGRLTHVADQLVKDGHTKHGAGRHRVRRCVDIEGSRPVRLCAQPVGDHKAAATVVAALDLSAYRSSADALLGGSIALDVVMLACTYALTRLAVGRALRPVGAMTDRATQWSAVGSARRFGGTARPTELARLGSSLDALLDRTDAVLRHERQLTGELSHELRTPLSRIIAELDWWRSKPRSPQETLATHEVIADAARSMGTICDTLLKEARDGSATLHGTAEIVPTLRRLAVDLAPPAHLRITVTGVAEHLEAGVRPALLERIVSPLLTNAIRYAREGIVVAARREADGVCVDITDDGPGVPAQFIEHLFQPGRRADPDDGHGGAGLGLPLARRLARSTGGEVHHDERHAPGARFVVTLPAG
ncbi:sensor histidine kinase [Streptomyces odontomachi]|uniref:sensor histidine kinase n=1 Tax=Streptomyces odontomachi TaxID=2944940 RepID=UPI00210F1EC6|nr:HAMP domain-containing sensor histidine kinase [Streptomyces sp. ODS25]